MALRDSGYSLGSDVLGYLFWGAVFVWYSFPFWGLIAAFLAGAAAMAGLFPDGYAWTERG